MTTDNLSRKTCPRCGAPLAADAPEGLCPRCLAAFPLAEETVFESDVEPAVAAPVPTPEELAPYFPQLDILACLGRGGMGVVYKARQKSLGRFVALKLLTPERASDPGFAARFEKEARVLAALNHPNIVTIHDFGRAGDRYFLLMEYVDGVNLREAMRAGRFTPEQALAVVPPVCDALQYAHDRGVVHRDIKPENLLVARDGRVKIADFGIAKLLDAGAPDERVAGDVTFAGSPHYMAPEQRGDAPADHRADIYSLGVVLYELLTGELPGAKLAPPSRKVAIDVRLDAIVLRALEQKPELRFANATEFRTQVEAVSDKTKTESEPAESGREFVFGPKSFPVVHIVVSRKKTAVGFLAIGFRARGVIAIGARAVGMIAVGGMSLGVLSLGGLSIGLVSLGGLAVGGLYAFGLVAVGLFSVGIFYSVGWWAVAVGDSLGVNASNACVLLSNPRTLQADVVAETGLRLTMLWRLGWPALMGVVLLTTEIVWRTVVALRRDWSDRSATRFLLMFKRMLWCSLGIAFLYGGVLSFRNYLERFPLYRGAGGREAGDYSEAFFRRTGINAERVVAEMLQNPWGRLSNDERQRLFDVEIPGLFFLNPEMPQDWSYWQNHVRFTAGSPAVLVVDCPVDASLNATLADRFTAAIRESFKRRLSAYARVGDDMIRYLERIDGGDYAECWDDAAEAVRNNIPKSAWVSRMTVERRPLGKVVSRLVISGPKNIDERDTLPGGRILEMKYRTRFESGDERIETLVFVWQSMLEPGTKSGWKAAGYEIGKVAPSSVSK